MPMSATIRRGLPRAQRRGFTLAELVVALLLFSLIGGTIMTFVMRQQRFYRSTADIIQLQGQLRQGASLLPLDLRMVSTSDTLVNSAATRFNADIYSKNDWSIEFRRGFGSSLICARRTTAPLDTLTLYPKATDSTAALSSWGIAPAVGDSVLILDERSLLGQGDDRWVAYEVRALTPVTGIRGCPWKGQIADLDPVTAGNQPDLSPLLYPADTVRQSFKLALDRAVPTTVMVGAPVRFFRRVRYEIYQAGDQQWYLGYSDCLRTYGTWNDCSEVTPVSGPYAPYTGATSENGIVLAYYDSLGNPLASTAQARLISRVDLVIRGQTSRNVTRTGAGAGEVYRDSLVLSVGIRNRR
jgi:prepilin-type N-terminal cleavage/methylation domain-containing protein